MLKHFTGIALLVIVCLLNSARADTPANCTYEDIRGTWVIHEGPRGQSKNIVCDSTVNVTSYKIVTLEFPNTAVDEDGNIGFWTIIYNQGFELVIHNRKYFAFSYYTGDDTNATSYCGLTFWGWAHETGVNPGDWSCYLGAKLNATEPKVSKSARVLKNKQKMIQALHEKMLYQKNVDFVETINSRQSSWTATHYPFMEQMSIADLVRRAGGRKSAILGKPKPAPVDKHTELLASSLPDSFDWRNVSGVSYVSPIRNQGSCGSCYAFASLGLNEARLRIKTLNQKQNIFSTQDIVECSQYSQGCEGGFPYLIAGKYGEDFGLVDEACNPYKGADGKCTTNKTCSRQYVTNYHYVGGFYGACNEALMRIELVKYGPLEVAFEVYDDFFNYKGGIYHHTGAADSKNYKFNPFELTNHAVLLVGYGADETTGEKFWIVKNSWGTGWGENGFFRIRRGTDECAIESIAVGADIVV